MSNLIAIDPGSNKSGVAIFKDGALVHATTINAKQSLSLQLKRVMLAADVFFHIDSLFDTFKIDPNQFDTYQVVSEEPFLQGKSNTSMQRYLGNLEEMFVGRINYIHPMTIKKFMGSGDSDKLSMALAAGEMLKTEAEQEVLAKAINEEAYDATDAVCVGLCYLGRTK